MSHYTGEDIEFSLGGILKNIPVVLFDNISFMEKSAAGIAAPAADTADGIAIYECNGSIAIDGAANQKITVYTINGRIVCTRTASSRELIDSSELCGANTYIVKAGTSVAKIMVK